MSISTPTQSKTYLPSPIPLETIRPCVSDISPFGSNSRLDLSTAVKPSALIGIASLIGHRPASICL